MIHVIYINIHKYICKIKSKLRYEIVPFEVLLTAFYNIRMK